MAFIGSKFEDDMEAGLDKLLTRIDGKVLIVGAAAMAKLIYDEVQLNVSGAREHPKVVTGNLKSSIYRAYSDLQSTDDRKQYGVSWNSKKAPHGHLIEFGTSTNPAYPFLRPAADHMQAAIAAGMKAIKQKLDEGAK